LLLLLSDNFYRSSRLNEGLVREPKSRKKAVAVLMRFLVFGECTAKNRCSL